MRDQISRDRLRREYWRGWQDALGLATIALCLLAIVARVVSA